MEVLGIRDKGQGIGKVRRTIHKAPPYERGEAPPLKPSSSGRNLFDFYMLLFRDAAYIALRLCGNLNDYVHGHVVLEHAQGDGASAFFNTQFTTF